MDRREIEDVAREPGHLIFGQKSALENCDRPLWVDSGRSGLPEAAGGGGRNRTLAARSSHN
jgi:hypothetical protein